MKRGRTKKDKKVHIMSRAGSSDFASICNYQETFATDDLITCEKCVDIQRNRDKNTMHRAEIPTDLP